MRKYTCEHPECKKPEACFLLREIDDSKKLIVNSYCPNFSEGYQALPYLTVVLSNCDTCCYSEFHDDDIYRGWSFLLSKEKK